MNISIRISPVNHPPLSYLTNERNTVFFLRHTDKAFFATGCVAKSSEHPSREEITISFFGESALAQSIPVYLGGKKFYPTTGELWEDFPDEEWYIPEEAFLEIDKQYYFVAYSVSGDPQPGVPEVPESGSARYGTGWESVIREGDDFSDWESAVKAATTMIASETMQKVVLARYRQFRVHDACAEEIRRNLLAMLDSVKTGEYAFLYQKHDAVLFGISPETILTIDGRDFSTEALAGSRSRGANDDEDGRLEAELLQSAKELSEHNFVTAHIADVIAPLSDWYNLPFRPIIKKLPTLQHLHTPIHGKLKDDVSFMETAGLLFPTPAVCGIPTETAQRFITKHERFERGYYAGMLGWHNPVGSGEVFACLRSGLYKDGCFYFFGGCGIVADSSAETEYQESGVKISYLQELTLCAVTGVEADRED